MPPRKESTSTEEKNPTVSEQLAQLISATTASSTTSNQTASQLSDLIQATHNLTTKIYHLTTHITAELSGTLTPPRHRSTPRHRSPNNRHPRQPKITLPLFDGSNILDWIFQAENYFSYYQTPVHERVELVVFYFTGDALSWYKHLANNELLGTWNAFKHEMELCFGPSSYENHEATLFKLKQMSTVAAFQTEFERVSNRVVGLSPQALRNCFISGLRADIQNELEILKPTTLHQAYALAKLVEEKIQHLSKHKQTYYPKHTTIPGTSTLSTPSASSTTNPMAPLLPTPQKTPTPYNLQNFQRKH